MNNKRRRLLRLADESLDTAYNYILRVLDEEQDCLGSMPESFQEGSQVEKMETAIDHLEMAAEHICDAQDSIGEAAL